MRAILPLALLAAIGCYSPRPAEPTPSPWSHGGGYGADAQEVGPLEASVYYDEYTGYASFDVSEDAHVSLFFLRPGGGLEMIYPAIGSGTRTAFREGRHTVRTAHSGFRSRGYRSISDYDPYGWGRWDSGPMYILLVASDEPLRVEQFMATRTMGWLRYSALTHSPYMALEALVGDIVPRPETSAWTTAMYVVWPSTRGDIQQRFERQRYTRVQCANGMVVTVPIEAVLSGYPVCPEHFQRPVPDSAADTTRIREVAPKRPTPPQGWITASIDGLDLRDELTRLREEHGKRAFGSLSIRPFPADLEIDRGSPWTRSGRAGIDSDASDRWATRPVARPGTSRSWPVARPATSRPSARPAPSRPDARPAPSRPDARPAPSRPVSRPAPSRPEPPPRPKPKPTNGGGGDPGS